MSLGRAYGYRVYSCIKTPGGDVELFAGELTGSTATGFEGWVADTLGETAVGIALRVPAPPFTCRFCGAPSWFDPADQSLPADYCHESDHGEAEPNHFDVLIRVGSALLPAGSADIDPGGVLRLTVASLVHHGRPSAFFAKAA